MEKTINLLLVILPLLQGSSITESPSTIGEGDPDVLRLSSEKDTEIMRFFNPFSVDSSLVPGGQTQRRRG